MSRAALPRIALLALIWGSAFLWIKLALHGLSPVQLTAARLATLTAGLALFAVLCWMLVMAFTDAVGDVLDVRVLVVMR